MTSILPHSPKLSFTVFTDRFAKTIDRKRATWNSICAVLQNPPEYPAKASCPLLKLATFSDNRTANGSLRSNDNLTSISGIEGDYDGEVVPISEAAALLQNAGVAALLYTSPSHTSGAPRWRVLCPLSQPHAPADRARFVEALNAILGGVLAPESFVLSQAFYFGRVRGAEYEVMEVRGQPIDLLEHVAGSDVSTSAIGIDQPVPAHLLNAKPDQATKALTEGTPKSFEVLLRRSLAEDGCAQVAYIYEAQEQMPEPLWLAGLSLAWHSADREQAIHLISEKYDGYEYHATVKKAQRTTGPRTCDWFRSKYPDRCNGCKHNVTSPIQLGESAIIHAMPLAQPANTDTWPQPDPLPNQLRNVQPFDLDLLPGALRPWVADIVERMQCPPDFVAVTALSALGTVIGRRIGIRPKRQDDWSEYCNLWACVVGRPGVMKSPAMTAALAPLHALAAKAYRLYEEERATYEAEEQVRALRIDAQKKSAAKALAKDPTAQIQIQSPDGGEAPVLRRYLVNDTSAEALLDICIENPQGVCAYRDELVSLLKSLDREGQEGSRGFYLTGWNGNSGYTADRIGRGRNMRAEAVCLSLLGSTQPGRIAEYLRAAISGGVSDDGLMQRFSLLVWPDTHLTWQNVDRWPDQQAKTVVFELFEKLDAADPVTDWGATIVTGHDGQPAEGEPPFVRLDDQAAATFLKWRSAFEAEINSGSLHPAMESHLSKYRKLIPSLALILHLADGGHGDVTDPAMKRALAWAHYLRSHAERAYGAATGLAGVASAEAVIKHLRRGDLARQFVARDVYRPQWAMLTSPEEANRAIAILLEYGWLRSEIRSTGGRPQTVFTANPFIFGERDSGSTHREAAA